LYHHLQRFYSQFQWWRFGSRILWNIARLRPDIVVFSEWWLLELSRLLRPQCALVGVWHTCKTTDGYFESAARYGDALDALVGVSEATSTNLVKYGGQKLQAKVNTIVYGVGHQGDSYPKRDFTSASPLKIAYMGRFEESQKRISDIPKIIATLRDRGCLFRMTLAGEGPDYIKTQRQFETLGIPTKFLGVLEPAEALRFWEEQDIMLLVSRHEGTPLSLLEAMSKGCVPVVSKSSGGVTEVVEDGTCGLTFDVGDIEGASRQLYRLCQDRSLLERLSIQTFELSHTYTVENMLRQYAALFHQVTAEKRGSWSARNYLSLAGRQAKTLFTQA
jgi:glycosyltransferase involved in cell wall biosynthesis